jgi:hypothetical protein
MATGKRTRKKRSAIAIARQADRKANRIRVSETRGHCRSRRYGTDLSTPKVDPDKRLYSFEDEYKTYRRTRGRRGLAPNPLKRQEENSQIALFKRSASHCGRFPIGQLMEHPVGRL